MTWSVVQAVGSCLLVVFLSYGLGKFKILKDKDYEQMDRFASKIIMPIMQFQCCAQRKFSQYDLRPLINQVLMNITSQILLTLVFLLPVKDKLHLYLNLSISAIFVNYLPIGLLIIESFYGDGYDTIIGLCPLSNFLVLVPFFLIWSQIWYMKKERENLGDEAAKNITIKDIGMAFLTVVRNPLIIATMCGILYATTELDYPIILEYFGKYAADCVLLYALFGVGNVLRKNGFIACPIPELAGALVIRFIVCPCISWLFVWITGVTGLMARFAILFAAMPASNGAYVIAQAAKVGVETTSSNIFFSLILIVPFIYFYMFLFDHFHLYEGE